MSAILLEPFDNAHRKAPSELVDVVFRVTCSKSSDEISADIALS
jgi:hypothetical protein